MLSDAGTEKCRDYNGSILFNNAIVSEQTVYIQANYNSSNNKLYKSKNSNVYKDEENKNSDLSPCLWLDFGAGTTYSSALSPWLDPICQDGEVTWNFYTNMKCDKEHLFASKRISTDYYTSNEKIDPKTVYCIITSTEYIGNSSDPDSFNSDAVTCIGDFLNLTVPDIVTQLPPLPPFYSWYSKYGKITMGTVFGASAISFLFYISWLRRAEEGDVVLYRLDMIKDKSGTVYPDDDDEESQTKKRSFSMKSISWYHLIRFRKTKKKYGLAVVVRGNKSLQLRPLRRLFGYLIDNERDPSSPYSISTPLHVLQNNIDNR